MALCFCTCIDLVNSMHIFQTGGVGIVEWVMSDLNDPMYFEDLVRPSGFNAYIFLQ
jgi:hypothetical protein